MTKLYVPGSGDQYNPPDMFPNCVFNLMEKVAESLDSEASYKEYVTSVSKIKFFCDSILNCIGADPDDNVDSK